MFNKSGEGGHSCLVLDLIESVGRGWRAHSQCNLKEIKASVGMNIQ